MALFSAVMAICWTTHVVLGCEPPQVRDRPNQSIVYFNYDQTVTLSCDTVTDLRDQQVEWLKNGQPIDYGELTNVQRLQDDQRALLTIHPGPEDSLSTFQCRVRTSCGVSLSNKWPLKLAFLEPFETTTVPRVVRAVVGSAVVLRCSPPPSSPAAAMSWAYMLPETDEWEDDIGEMGPYHQIALDNRVTMDYDGNLYITYVEPQDQLEGGVPYLCEANNKHTRSIALGNDTKLIVQDYPSFDQALELMWRSPANVVVLEGKKLKMKCIFSGGARTTIRWSRSDGQLDSSRTQVDHFEITISDVSPEDAGQYTCEGEDGLHLNRMGAVFNVSVEAKPSWMAPQRDVSLQEGEDVTFSCEAAGQPTPNLQWYINGVPLEDTPPSPRRVLYVHTLTFRDVLAEDTAVIQCNASNAHGSVYQDFSLQVQGCRPPSVSDLQQRRENVFSEDWILSPLQCRAQGSEDLRYTWLMNGRGLDLRATHITTVEGGQDLYLNQKDIQQDTVHFQCQVSNACGTSLSAIYVYRRAVLEPFPAAEPREITVPAGSRSVTLYCVPPHSIPEARVMWFTRTRNWDRPMQPISPNGRFMVDESNRLHIVNVQPEDGDRGIYFCMAANQFLRQTRVSAGFRLNVVQGQPDRPEYLHLLGRSPFEVRTTVGGSVSLQCLFAGDPIASLRWWRGRNAGDLDLNRTTLTQYQMTIEEVRESDGGQYFCEGYNGGHQRNQSSEFWIIVESEPAWVARPRDQIVHTGDSVTLLCEGDGVPTPTVQWYINGQPIQDVPSHHPLASPTNLTFPAVGPEDSQVVQCNVSNSRGYLWADVFLQVL